MDALSPEQLIKSAADNGWDFFKDILQGNPNVPVQISQAQIERAVALAADAATVYATPSGERLINHLIEITLLRQTHVAMLGLEMEKAYGHGCHREGQNSIVFTLCKMIAEGRKEPPPQERTAHVDPTETAAAFAAASRRRRRRKR